MDAEEPWVLSLGAMRFLISQRYFAALLAFVLPKMYSFFEVKR